MVSLECRGCGGEIDPDDETSYQDVDMYHRQCDPGDDQ